MTSPSPGTFYPRSAFGSTNPNAGRPPNGDRAAWGGYAWPQGVPANLLGTTDYQSRSSGQRLRVQVRRELVELYTLAMQIMDQVHGYAVWANVNGENWGPWGYSNRAVAGSNTPSGHSMALSVDFNAPWNPMSSTWQTNMPPPMVADLESLGLFWGGRYTGQTDTMHYGYCFPPASVAGHVSRARSILAAGGGGSNPTPDPGDDDVTDDQINTIVERTAARVMDRLRNDNVVRMTTIDQSTGAESVQDVSATRSWQSAQTQAARAAYRSR